MASLTDGDRCLMLPRAQGREETNDPSLAPGDTLGLVPQRALGCLKARWSFRSLKLAEALNRLPPLLPKAWWSMRGLQRGLVWNPPVSPFRPADPSTAAGE